MAAEKKAPAEKKAKRTPPKKAKQAVKAKFQSSDGKRILTVKAVQYEDSDFRIYSTVVTGKRGDKDRTRQKSSVTRVGDAETANARFEELRTLAVSKGWLELERKQKFDYEDIPDAE